jgi:hypothetical protein
MLGEDAMKELGARPGSRRKRPVRRRAARKPAGVKAP